MAGDLTRGRDAVTKRLVDESNRRNGRDKLTSDSAARFLAAQLRKSEQKKRDRGS